MTDIIPGNPFDPIRQAIMDLVSDEDDEPQFNTTMDAVTKAEVAYNRAIYEAARDKRLLKVAHALLDDSLERAKKLDAKRAQAERLMLAAEDSLEAADARANAAQERIAELEAELAQVRDDAQHDAWDRGDAADMARDGHG